jgi:hypothetical protein
MVEFIVFYSGALLLGFSSLKILSEIIFLAEVYFLLSSLLIIFWLIVTWCIVILLHHLPSVLFGLFVHLPLSFSASWLRHESWGGVGI